MEGCVREVKEEIGLHLQQSDITLLSRSLGKDCIFDEYVVICDFPIGKAILQPEEVSELKWVTLQQIKELFFAGEFMMDDIDEMKKVKAYIRSQIG